MLSAIKDGLAGTRRSYGLVFLLLGVNLGLAASLAIPFSNQMEKDLAKTASAESMMYGFDYSFWSQWSERQTGFAGNFGPDILGVGFAFKNLDLLLRGQLPAGVFSRLTEGGGGGGAALDPVILGLGLGYLLLQVFLTGGLLGVLRGEQGGWTLRGLLQGSGFYFGRLLRIALLALVVDLILFRLNVPVARWVDTQAREAVSEATAMTWALGRYALLLLGLLTVHMVSTYAKVIVVLEERSSAILAFLSAISFCARNLLRAAGLYGLIALSGILLLALWQALDGAWTVTGYKSQILALLLAQALVLGRIALRLMLLGGQLSLYRRFSSL
jgi:hypothetical protein